MPDKKLWSVKVATLQDVLNISKELRSDDVNELYAATGNTPVVALLESYLYPNTATWVASIDDKPAIIFGVTLSPIGGVPWLLATPQIEKAPISFLRGCREWYKLFLHQYGELRNFVDERNELHIKWLKWLGFDFIKRHEKYGHEQLPFWEFVKRK